MKRYISGQQAIDEGVINEEQWQQAITHPWTWVIVKATAGVYFSRLLLTALKVREIPWQGLEVEVTDCEVKIEC